MRYSGGNVLGLYTCKRPIEANNGHIGYVTEDAKGAKSRIEFPKDQIPDSSAA
jgi:K+-sensing histidine kinase KdpD